VLRSIAGSPTGYKGDAALKIGEVCEAFQPNPEFNSLLSSSLTSSSPVFPFRDRKAG
jgi:hypothetical protein